MNKAIGLSIGIAVAVIAIVVAGSTIFTDVEMNPLSGLPNDDENQMTMGDSISVTVTPSEDTEQQVDETEGKNIQVNIVDGVSATSEP